MIRIGFGASTRRPGRRWSPELEQLAQRVIEAAIEVHRALGPGYPESVYEGALSIELGERGLAYERQSPVRVEYRGQCVGEGRIDILVEQRLVVELKVVEELNRIHTAQVIGYLRTLNLRLGILINFHSAILKDGIKRVIL